MIFTFLMKDSGADGLHLCCSSYFISIEIEIVLNQSFHTESLLQIIDMAYRKVYVNGGTKSMNERCKI